MMKYAAQIQPTSSGGRSNSAHVNTQTEHGIKKKILLSFQRWRDSCSYLKQHEVELDLRLKYIFTGYRRSHSSFSYYVKSIVSPCNQSVNVWTHFLPLLFFLYRHYNFLTEVENPRDPINYPYYVHVIGVCAVLLISSIAHTFCSHSPMSSRCCFGADFAAIYNYGLSFLVPLEFYLCPMRYHCQGPNSVNYIVIMVSYASLSATVCFFADHRGSKYVAAIRTFSYVIGLGTIFLPCIVRYYIYNSTHHTSEHPSLVIGHDYAFLFFVQLFFIGLSSFLYTTKFPESSFPGKFDLIGHSHNWFHILSALAMYAQDVLLRVVLKDIKIGIHKGEFSEHHFDISWGGTIGAFILSTIISNLIVLCYSRVMKDRPKQKTN